MIRQCNKDDFEAIFEIVNDAAQAYKGVIPPDCWKEPYMPREELAHEIENGIVFWGYEEDEHLLGVMGMQYVQDVTLIRHAYVRTANRGKGIGSNLLSYVRNINTKDHPILIGTWVDAVWAIRFYQRYGFRLVNLDEKDILLKKCWSVPERQVETSVVLAEDKWFELDKMLNV